MLLHDFASNNPAVDDVIQITDYFMRGRTLVYVASPVSTGQRYIDWYAADGYRYITQSEFTQARIKAVIEPNCRKAIAITQQIIASNKFAFDQLIYCPAELLFANWSHTDALRLCHHMIKNYAMALVFLPGWHTSFGCVQEFYLAQELKLLCYDHNLRLFDPLQEIEQITATIAKLVAVKLPTDGMTLYIDKLKYLLLRQGKVPA